MSSRTNHERLVALEAAMDSAVACLDFEQAASLRDEITRLRGQADDIVGQPPPGQMGLGSNAPVREPPKGWVPPKKPDLMTRTTKGRNR